MDEGARYVISRKLCQAQASLDPRRAYPLRIHMYSRATSTTLHAVDRIVKCSLSDKKADSTAPHRRSWLFPSPKSVRPVLTLPAIRDLSAKGYNQISTASSDCSRRLRR